MRVLLIYFSRTGNTQKIADLIIERLHIEKIECEVFKIEPVFDLPYLLWLFLSFVPSLPFPVKNLKFLNLEKFDIVILGTPKWTFNCPPVTSFIYKLKKFSKLASLNSKQSLPKIFTFLTYGGFREDVYLEKLMKKIKNFGFEIIAFEKFKRSEIQSGEFIWKVDRFCKLILKSINPSDLDISKP